MTPDISQMKDHERVAHILGKANGKVEGHAWGYTEKSDTEWLCAKVLSLIDRLERAEGGQVFGDIHRERIAQDQKHGGPQHDDTHNVDDWWSYILDHADRARHGTPQECRHEMIKVAALAVAAVESFDRHAALSSQESSNGK